RQSSIGPLVAFDTLNACFHIPGYRRFFLFTRVAQLFHNKLGENRGGYLLQASMWIPHEVAQGFRQFDRGNGGKLQMRGSTALFPDGYERDALTFPGGYLL